MHQSLRRILYVWYVISSYLIRINSTNQYLLAKIFEHPYIDISFHNLWHSVPGDSLISLVSIGKQLMLAFLKHVRFQSHRKNNSSEKRVLWQNSVKHGVISISYIQKDLKFLNIGDIYGSWPNSKFTDCEFILVCVLLYEFSRLSWKYQNFILIAAQPSHLSDSLQNHNCALLLSHNFSA